jgi:hypothetical protein
MIASNADSFHSNDCARGPTIEHCEFAHTMDDYVNVHSTLFLVQSSSGDKIVLTMRRGLPVVGGAGSEALDMWDGTTNPMSNVQSGDSITCQHNNDKGPTKPCPRIQIVATSVAASPSPSLLPTRWTVTAASKIPAGVVAGMLCSIDRLSAVGASMRHNIFRESLPGCGIRWKSSHSTIENNVSLITPSCRFFSKLD